MVRRLRCPVETSTQIVLPDAHDHRHAHLPAQQAPRPALGRQLVAQHEMELEPQQGRAAPPRRRRGGMLLWLLSLQPMQASAGGQLRVRPKLADSWDIGK